MKVTDSDICERCEVAPVAGYALAEPGITLEFIALCEKCLDTIEDDLEDRGRKGCRVAKLGRKLAGGKGGTEAKASQERRACVARDSQGC